MARMYSRKKGKSGSRKPSQKKATWIRYKPEEIEEIAVKLAKEDKSSAEIGTALRDQYGVPSIRSATGKKMMAVMKEHDLAKTFPEDLNNLLKRAVKLRAHLENKKHDRYSKRGLELTESKIRRLAKYYKGRDILDKKWNYDPEKAKLFVR